MGKFSPKMRMYGHVHREERISHVYVAPAEGGGNEANHRLAEAEYFLIGLLVLKPTSFETRVYYTHKLH